MLPRPDGGKRKASGKLQQRRRSDSKYSPPSGNAFAEQLFKQAYVPPAQKGLPGNVAFCPGHTAPGDGGGAQIIFAEPFIKHARDPPV